MPKQTELLPAGHAALEKAPEHDPLDISGIIRHAIDRGVPVETMERLVDLHCKVSDRAARAEFAAAMAAFQAECPDIPKESKAHIAAAKSYSYRYAELDTIRRVIGPVLQKHHLSYSWDSTVDANMLTCTCIVRHVNGHSESARFAAPVDSRAAMSETQKHAAALTFARRQALVQVLGLTMTEEDTDGAVPSGTITASQAADLRAKMEEVGADEERFLKFLDVESFEEVRVEQFSQAIAALDRKRSK